MIGDLESCNPMSDGLCTAHNQDGRLCRKQAVDEWDRLRLAHESLKAQLRTAQEVIDKHVADQIEGLHCVDCVAESDEECDCPMLVPIFEAMKGYEQRKSSVSCCHPHTPGVSCSCGCHATSDARGSDERRG